MGAIHDGWTADQVRAAEAPLLAAGVPLMRRAAAALAALLRSEAETGQMVGAEVLLLAGSGDNGGDGLFAVTELAAAGMPVRVVPTGSRIHLDGLAAARAAGAVVEDGAADDPAALVRSLPERVLIVDAMLGIGAASAGLRGRAHEVAAALLPRLAERRSGVRVIAVDVPSGIGVDDGAVPDDGVMLPADATVVFGAMKAGLLMQPARAQAGDIRLIDLGLGEQLADREPAVRV